MMEAAKAACKPETKLLAVTILTSLNQAAIDQVGYKDNLSDQVIRLARLAKSSGLDGVVCSSHEIEHIRNSCSSSFETMVPGIRPIGSAKTDQKRVMTPKEAVQKGATNIVIGRPITGAKEPDKAAAAILDSLK